MIEAINETAADSGRFPNRKRMWRAWNEQVLLKRVRVRGTSMETNEKTDKTRIKEKRLVQVPVIMRSKLIRGHMPGELL